MNVTTGALREVVVDDELDALEVYAPSHHVGRDQTPNLALGEASYDLVALFRCTLSVDGVGVDAVEEQLGGELLGALNGLDEDEDGGSELAFADESAEGEKLVILGADELQRLFDRLGGGVPVRQHESALETSIDARQVNSLVTDDSTDSSDSSSTHDRLGHLLNTAGHRRREHALAKVGVRASGDDLVGLLHKVELEQLVGLVEDEVADTVGREEA